MDNMQKRPSHFNNASHDAETAESAATKTPQTMDPSYKLAFRDPDFLLRDDLRPVRFQLELLKPEILLEESDVHSTLVIYGSARIPSPKQAEDLLKKAGDNPKKQEVAKRLAGKAHHYETARLLAYLASKANKRTNGKRDYVVCSGGGPSIMEAANRGAADAKMSSIGLNIVLPHEQAPNRYVTPSLSFQFHYFALRKMHFLLRAKAVAIFPGGFGTMDEFFELLTLVQTGKMEPLPILLFGSDFWNKIINFEELALEGTINEEDLSLFHHIDDAKEGWEIIRNFYKKKEETT